MTTSYTGRKPALEPVKLCPRCLSSPRSACGWCGCMSALVPALLMRPSACAADCGGLRPGIDIHLHLPGEEKLSRGRARRTSSERDVPGEGIKKMR